MRKLIDKIIKVSITSVFFIVILNLSGFGQDMTVPANLQAALFKKIFAFNKTLSGKNEVVVIGSGGSDIAGAFKEVGVSAKTADQAPAGAAIVYVMPGANPPKQKGTLSISGVAAYAESGKVAIAIGTEGGKPKIIIHMAQLKAEGQDVSADLLKIAKVIQ